jgi:thiamine-phosphate pyrophosphorylase
MRGIDWRLCLVADTSFRRGLELINLVMDAVEAGAGLVQLRAKNLPDRETLQLSLALSAKLGKHRIPLLINDRPDLALAGKASGVHLGQDDLPLAYARGLVGTDHLIGISAATVEEARRAWHGGADYIGAGPVFATSTKDYGRPPLGPDGLRAICDAVRVPVLAIGGIKTSNARAAIQAGADGIAVISAILGAPDPGHATADILQAAFGPDREPSA